jgi:hypothetical protein
MFCTQLYTDVRNCYQVGQQQIDPGIFCDKEINRKRQYKQKARGAITAARAIKKK